MTDRTVDFHSEIPPLANRLTAKSIAAIEAAGNTVIITVDDQPPVLPEPGHSPDYLRGWHDCYARVLEMLSVGFTPR